MCVYTQFQLVCLKDILLVSSSILSKVVYAYNVSLLNMSTGTLESILSKCTKQDCELVEIGLCLISQKETIFTSNFLNKRDTKIPIVWWRKGLQPLWYQNRIWLFGGSLNNAMLVHYKHSLTLTWWHFKCFLGYPSFGGAIF